MQIHRHDDYYDDSDYYMYVLSVAICFLLCPVLGPQDAVQKEWVLLPGSHLRGGFTHGHHPDTKTRSNLQAHPHGHIITWRHAHTQTHKHVHTHTDTSTCTHTRTHTSVSSQSTHLSFVYVAGLQWASSCASTSCASDTGMPWVSGVCVCVCVCVCV